MKTNKIRNICSCLFVFMSFYFANSELSTDPSGFSIPTPIATTPSDPFAVDNNLLEDLDGLIAGLKFSTFATTENSLENTESTTNIQELTTTTSAEVTQKSTSMDVTETTSETEATTFSETVATTLAATDLLTDFFVLHSKNPKQFSHLFVFASQPPMRSETECEMKDTHVLQYGFSLLLPRLAAENAGEDLFYQVEICKLKERHNAWETMIREVEKVRELNSSSRYDCQKSMKLEQIRCRQTIRMLCSLLRGDRGLSIKTAQSQLERIVNTAAKSRTALNNCADLRDILESDLVEYGELLEKTPALLMLYSVK